MMRLCNQSSLQFIKVINNHHSGIGTPSKSTNLPFSSLLSAVINSNIYEAVRSGPIKLPSGCLALLRNRGYTDRATAFRFVNSNSLAIDLHNASWAVL